MDDKPMGWKCVKHNKVGCGDCIEKEIELFNLEQKLDIPYKNRYYNKNKRS